MSDQVSNNTVISIHLAEFNALRQEIEMLLSSQTNLVNFSILIVGALVSLFAITENLVQENPYLLLVGSLLLSCISLQMVDTDYALRRLGSYIQYDLAPKIQFLVGEDGEAYKVLGWESKAFRMDPQLLMRGITGLGKYGISYISSILSLILFLEFRIDTPWQLFEILLLLATTLLLIIVPLLGISNIRALTNRGQEKLFVRK